MIRARYILYTVFILLLINIAWAQIPENVFNHGNELYRGGNFREAIKEYESIIKQGSVSAEIYFNLGNAYYRDEQLARAILSYERSALLRPGDPDIEHNLKLLYLKTVDRIEPIPDMFIIQWMRVVGSLMSPETARILFVISWILLFGSLTIMYLVMRPNVLHVARISFFVSIICVVIFALMLGVQLFQDSSKDKAIVTDTTVTAKSSPDLNAVDAFVIHEGVKVKLTDTVGDWVKIILLDGKVGWILAEQCERI